MFKDLVVRSWRLTDLIGAPTHPLKAAAIEFVFATERAMTPHQALVAGTIAGAGRTIRQSSKLSIEI